MTTTLWVWFAVTTYFLWAITTLFDKYIVGNKIKNPYVNAVFFGLLSSIGILFFPLVNVHYDHWVYLVIALLGGILFILGHLPFYKILDHHEVSRVVVVWQTIPLFVLLLSYLFLQEQLSVYDYIAFFLLVAGGFIVNVTSLTLSLNKAFWYMLFSSIIFSFSYFFQKLAYNHGDFWLMFVVIIIGFFIGSCLLLLINSVRHDFYKHLVSKDKVLYGALLFKAALGIPAFLSINYAISLASVSLVNALEGLYAVFVFGGTLLTSYFLPHFVKEEISWKIFFQKSIAIVMVVVGTVLLALS
ncbi:DMT family transporter [Candidatus Woesearchaeota archaeon]|nr:DMT family transporter [Candidatus Woesearchaeota archaeon]